MLRYVFLKIPFIKRLVNKNTQLSQKNKYLQKQSNVYYTYYLNHQKYNDLSEEEKLQFLEIKYGGYVTNIKQTKLIVKDHIYKNHDGGDRFNIFHNNYSKIYTHYLKKVKPVTNLLEIGILKGTGLAIWDTYFPDAQLYGFDWDLGNFEKNYEYLLEQGAFKNHKPNLFQYDQFKDNSNWLKENFSKISFDIIIDDAFHSDESIINSFEELIPYFSEDIIYIIEDNKTAWKKLETKYPKYKFDNYGKIKVVTSR